MAERYLELYQNMDKLDFAKLAELADCKSWPKGKRYTVELGGKVFKIQTYFSKAADHEPSDGYDAYEAIASLRDKPLSEEQMWQPYGESRPPAPEFDEDVLESLTPKQIKQRIGFLIAVANLINNQETMEAIVNAAPKKKNGTLHKNRLVRIAGSGIGVNFNDVYAIIGRAKSDDSISVTVEEVRCRIGENEVWGTDFVSTYHEGLPVSEAMKAILP